jgi:hypothetical protein
MKRPLNLLTVPGSAMCLSILGAAATAGMSIVQDVRQADEAFVQQFEQQWTPQFRQAYKSEMHFMRIACQPTRQEFEKIKSETEPQLRDTLRKLAVSQRWQHLYKALPEPRVMLANLIAKSVGTTLTPEQAARYQHELEQRATARKQAVLSQLVSRLDKVLILTAEQRAQISEGLKRKWKDSWINTPMYSFGPQYFPALPDDAIVPFLTQAQKAVWNGIQKMDYRFGMDLSIMNNATIEEEIWDDDRSTKDATRPDRRIEEKAKDRPNREVKK